MPASFAFTSSIDFAPKFLMSSRSASERATSSPTEWMPSRLRQLYDRTVSSSSSMGSARSAASAGKTLVELFGLARELNVEAEGVDIGPSPVDEQLAADLALPVEDLSLTVRSYNCLKREGIHTVGELISRSEQDLLDIRNFGAKSIDEVKAKLAEMGLALKDSAPGFDARAAMESYDDDQSFAEDEQY